jgi:hypothetical protein
VERLQQTKKLTEERPEVPLDEKTRKLTEESGVSVVTRRKLEEEAAQWSTPRVVMVNTTRQTCLIGEHNMIGPRL